MLTHPRKEPYHTSGSVHGPRGVLSSLSPRAFLLPLRGSLRALLREAIELQRNTQDALEGLLVGVADSTGVWVCIDHIGAVSLAFISAIEVSPLQNPLVACFGYSDKKAIVEVQHPVTSVCAD